MFVFLLFVFIYAQEMQFTIKYHKTYIIMVYLIQFAFRLN